MSLPIWRPVHPPPPTTLRRGLVSGEQLDLLAAECKERLRDSFRKDTGGGSQCDRALQQAAERGVLNTHAGDARVHIANLQDGRATLMGYGGRWRGVLCVTGEVDVFTVSMSCVREALTLSPGDCVCGVVELLEPSVGPQRGRHDPRDAS